MALPSKYFDKYGHIKQKQNTYDGGDSFSFAGQYMVAVHWQFKTGVINRKEYERVKSWYRKVVADLYIGYGVFARHSRYNPWATRWTRMSRDQTKANIYAMAIAGDHKHLLLMMFFLILRLGFTTNIYKNRLPISEENLKNAKLPDWCGPDIWGMYVRALPMLSPYYLPLALILSLPTLVLWLSDIQLLINAMLKCENAKENPGDTNETNFICALLQARETGLSLFSESAIQIYKKRPLAPIGVMSTERKTNFGPQSALDHFFGGRHDLEPPLHEEYRPFLEKVFVRGS